MQYSLKYDVHIDNNSVDIQIFFESVNIMLPSIATGSCFTHVSGNAKRIKFFVPRMKKQINFTVEDSQEFEPVLQTYNLAASLQDCVICFTLSHDILTIQFLTESQDTFKLLKEISTRLEQINK